MEPQHKDFKFKMKIISTTVVIVVLGIIGIYEIINHHKNDVIIQEQEFKDTVRLDTFSEANLNSMMYILDIQHPEIVINQSKLETGNYTSVAFKKHNNLFGFMKGNKIRHYDNWKQSLIHYSHWQNVNYKDGNYYIFLKNIGYATDSLYIQKLKLMKNV